MSKCLMWPSVMNTMQMYLQELRRDTHADFLKLLLVFPPNSLTLERPTNISMVVDEGSCAETVLFPLFSLKMAIHLLWNHDSFSPHDGHNIVVVGSPVKVMKCKRNITIYLCYLEFCFKK